MNQQFEVTGQFETEASCDKLLYTPQSQPLTYRQSQCYSIDFEGDPAALTSFIARVLLDPISQSLHQGAEPVFANAKFVLEYGMKGGALDLEKETILQYFRALPEPGFQLTKLTLRKRIYVFGDSADSAPFVRDVVNPAIHTCRVIQLAA